MVWRGGGVCCLYGDGLPVRLKIEIVSSWDSLWLQHLLSDASHSCVCRLLFEIKWQHIWNDIELFWIQLDVLKSYKSSSFGVSQVPMPGMSPSIGPSSYPSYGFPGAIFAARQSMWIHPPNSWRRAQCCTATFANSIRNRCRGAPGGLGGAQGARFSCLEQWWGEIFCFYAFWLRFQQRLGFSQRWMSILLSLFCGSQWRYLVFVVASNSRGSSQILVGGLEHFLFFHMLGMSSSQLTFIFFRVVGQPPTRILCEVNEDMDFSSLHHCPLQVSLSKIKVTRAHNIVVRLGLVYFPRCPQTLTIHVQ